MPGEIRSCFSDTQRRQIEPYFPLSHGVPRVDNRRVISGIIFAIRNGMRGRDAPRIATGKDNLQPLHPLKQGLASSTRFSPNWWTSGKPDRLMIDAAHLNAHRSAASLLRRGLFPYVTGAPKAA